MHAGLILLSLLTPLALCATAATCGVLAKWEFEADFSGFTMSCARWDTGSGGIVVERPEAASDAGPPSGIVESSEVSVAGGFDEAVVSWNAVAPPGSFVRVYLRARVGESWTGWYNMGLWNTDGRPGPRTSFKGQNDEFARVETDVLALKKRADAFKVRVEMSSADGGSYPTLRLLAVDVSATSASDSADPPLKAVWGAELDVPEMCQLSVEGGRPWCSATSTAMVLNYWSRKLDRPELAVGITDVVRGVHDEAWGGTGNWVFNTAYAGGFEGIRAYVARLNTLARVEELIASGVPPVVSLDYNRLNRRKTSRSMGHLMVVRGFTASGDVVVNDPWAHLDKGQSVRKVFKRADFKAAWLGRTGSRGTVYLIYPRDWPQASPEKQ